MDPEITGGAALSNVSEEEWSEHERKVFKKCYFDEDINCFYIHNGIEYLGLFPLTPSTYGIELNNLTINM